MVCLIRAGSYLAGVLKVILKERENQFLLYGGQILKSFHHMERSLKDGLTPVVSLKKISLVIYIGLGAFKGAIRDILH